MFTFQNDKELPKKENMLIESSFEIIENQTE